MNSERVHQFKIVVVGEGGTGKTTFLNRHLHGGFQTPYIPTIGAQVYNLMFDTNYGRIRFNCWDMPGQDALKNGLPPTNNNNICGAQGAIIMFDVTSRETYRKVKEWHDQVCCICPNIPFILCGNKVDSTIRMVTTKEVNFHRKVRNMEYMEISVLANYNLERPFLSLARKLTRTPNLNFVTMPFQWPEVQMSSEQHAKIEEGLAYANRPLLKNKDEDDMMTDAI